MKRILLVSIFLVTMLKLSGQDWEINLQSIFNDGSDTKIVDVHGNYALNNQINTLFDRLGENAIVEYQEENKKNTNGSNMKIAELSQNGKSKYLIRSTLGMNGLSKTITSSTGTYFIQQSIGQASVIGTYTKDNYTIRQGFQQPLHSGKKLINMENSLKANLYPNPFRQTLNILFDEKITDDLFVVIYNLSGKVLFSNKYPASQKLNLPLSYMINGNYILKITADNKQLVVKILKQ